MDVAAALAEVTAALPGGGESRPGQLAMAEAVASAVREQRHLVVQAGTGTGKSLAYLVPLLVSGSKVVVSTATKALQDQLAAKDLPLIAQCLGGRVDVEFAVLKGRSNYLCRQRAREVDGGGAEGGDQLALDDGTVAETTGAISGDLKRLLAWSATSTTGDRADLDFEPHPRAWAQLSVSAMECPGAARCPSGDVCFAEAARKRAEDAAVVVVNTHLYGAHLASGGHVLPEHDVVVFDEAHELEDIAAASLGLELGAGRFTALARTARPLVAADDRRTLDDLETAGDIVERAAMAWHGKRLPAPLPDDMIDAFALAAERVTRAVAAVRAVSGDDARKARALQAGGHLAGDLAFLQAGGKDDVLWVEGPPHAPVVRIAPVVVGERLADAVWADRTAILTSATIPLRLVERLGLPADGTTELDVGSPFDYGEQALLYCSAHLPDPRDKAYEAAMHDELVALIGAAGGRTLALFTSWRAMDAAVAAVRPRVDVPVLAQSDLPKPALIRAFADDEATCLFATMGFWQGVDVPGASLSVVTIDRLPFARPDEPLMQARRDRAGQAAFRVIDLPRAATLLAQGTGRLIRALDDRGVVAVLDPRLAKAGYRWDLVRALPPMRRTRHMAEVQEFLAPLRLGPA